jgi:hypothetical protein
MSTAGLSPRALRRIARKLQAGHAKETTDQVPTWADLPDEERRLWLRLAARAVAATIQELTAIDVDVDPVIDKGTA